ncbi:MAG: RsmB/NOP family class I SAM-dependent RNA methyltransferase [Paracoccaceae bacterium]|nr:RsmB/NOP family class I SAM-dependent RNA methyltransferase [Paracoccaceae bacterium]
MTPAARVQAAIEVIDDFLTGRSGEVALTAWARRSRYAGSSDRAAVRDHVYDALRHLRSYAARGGGMSGRPIMIAALQQHGIDPQSIFTGDRFAPETLSAKEQEKSDFKSEAEKFDIPDWLWPIWCQDLADHAEQVADNLRQRAPVFLRVNIALTTREVACQKLCDEGINTEAHPFVPTALKVIDGARKVALSDSYKQGLVELQDASSQASVCALTSDIKGPVLDYCAGGGGKALALAAWLGKKVHAHDAQAQRMKDLPVRAKRAQADIVLKTVDQIQNAKYGLVFCDVPCSGSGAWRRDPSGKWNLNTDQLDDLLTTQFDILSKAADLAAPDGVLFYATCSVLERENGQQISRFLNKNGQWSLVNSRQFLPDADGDGFYFAILQNG